MLYRRFPLSLRNVEDLLHERGVDVSYESVRYWWHRFGSQFASEIKKRRAGGMQSSNWKWHLDEVFVKINGEMHYLWRAMDHEGEVLESYVTKRRNRKAALKFLRKKNEASRSPSYPGDRQTPVLRRGNEGHRQRWPTGNRPLENNRAENSHLPFRRRERAMQRFRSMRSLQ